MARRALGTAEFFGGFPNARDLRRPFFTPDGDCPGYLNAGREWYSLCHNARKVKAVRLTPIQLGAPRPWVTAPAPPRVARPVSMLRGVAGCPG